MITGIKIIITIVIIMIGTVISVALSGSNSNSKAPLFLIIGMVAGITAVWKYKSKKPTSSTDKQELDKS